MEFTSRKLLLGEHIRVAEVAREDHWFFCILDRLKEVCFPTVPPRGDCPRPRRSPE
jgi:hypothetical protein